jgi:hypothetical protein
MLLATPSIFGSMWTIEDIFGKSLNCNQRADMSRARQKEKEEKNCGEHCCVRLESVKTVT